MDISCIVLAGGKGLRLGRNKASETINSSTLLEQAIYQLDFLNSDIIIVVAQNQPLPGLTVDSRVKIVTDKYPGKGPLVGIYTGLNASDSFFNLVVACDMPFMNRGLLQYMLEETEGYDAVVPRLGNMVEPLHAVYTRNCLSPAESLIKQGDMSVHNLLPLINTRYVEAGEIDRFDPEHLSFFNINTRADLEAARTISGDVS